MENLPALTVSMILARLALAAVIGGVIGYERRLHRKAIGIAGMMLVAMGSTTYLMVARQVSATDTGAVGRAIQGILQGIGFLGGAVIFKTGADVRGIKTAASIWITGAIGLAVGLELWPLGILVGLATVAILFAADLAPRLGPGAAQPDEEDEEDEGPASGKIQDRLDKR